MEISKKQFDGNIESLKSSIEGEITVKSKNADDKEVEKAVKGHVFCDVVQLTNTKIDGYSNGEVVKKSVLVEAKHALHQTENFKTTHKVYLIVKQA